MAQVKIIAAKQVQAIEKIPTCAYTRVSTDSRSQEESLENQIEALERTIRSNPKYEFMGVYSNQGISGSSEKRPQFQEMIQRARREEIRLIITKSISRFARNTVTVLKVARELKELGVGIFFEKENIHTLTADGELMLTVYASFAQEESRSASENNRWSIKKKFERGEVMINTSRFCGYDKNEYGELVINPKEALIVNFVFDMYLLGVGFSRMASLLAWLGVPSVTGAAWHARSLRGMVYNEKYKGDAHLQKTYTPENRRNYTVPNRGEVQSYYITRNHPPIVPPEKWESVQQKIASNRSKRNIGAGGTKKYTNRYPLSGLLVCPYCGRNLIRRQVYNKKIQWLCSTYIEAGVAVCKGIRIDDAEVAKRNITEPTVVEEEILDGEKHYRYTCKTEFDRRGGNSPEPAEDQTGSVLPCFDRQRRTAIKLSESAQLLRILYQK